MAIIKLGPQSKSDHIRQVLQQGIEKPKEVVEALAKKGITVEVGLVNSVKSQEKKKAEAVDFAQDEANAKKYRAETLSKAAQANGQTTSIVEGIKAVQDVIAKVGGKETLKEILALLDK
jgi:hypothetical protein